jgi:hypothetical protein
MERRYRITPGGQGREPDDAELSRYRNSGKLLFNYQRARDTLHRRPLYKDPKAFLVLLIIVLLAWVLGEAGSRKPPVDPSPSEQPAP